MYKKIKDINDSIPVWIKNSISFLVKISFVIGVSIFAINNFTVLKIDTANNVLNFAPSEQKFGNFYYESETVKGILYPNDNESAPDLILKNLGCTWKYNDDGSINYSCSFVSLAVPGAFVKENRTLNNTVFVLPDGQSAYIQFLKPDMQPIYFGTCFVSKVDGSTNCFIYDDFKLQNFTDPKICARIPIEIAADGNVTFWASKAEVYC